MRVLIVGAGGREHAIALNCRTSGHDVVMVADVTGIEARLSGVDLVIPGPEAALVAGIASACASPTEIG